MRRALRLLAWPRESSDWCDATARTTPSIELGGVPDYHLPSPDHRSIQLVAEAILGASQTTNVWPGKDKSSSENWSARGVAADRLGSRRRIRHQRPNVDSLDPRSKPSPIDPLRGEGEWNHARFGRNHDCHVAGDVGSGARPGCHHQIPHDRPAVTADCPQRQCLKAQMRRAVSDRRKSA